MERELDVTFYDDDIDADDIPEEWCRFHNAAHREGGFICEVIAAENWLGES